MLSSPPMYACVITAIRRLYHEAGNVHYSRRLATAETSSDAGGFTVESTTIFTESAYQGQTFTDLVVEGATFDRIEFEECHLVGCRFPSCVFQGCAFVNCAFTLCDLGLMRVPASRFTEAQFTDCKLIGVDWTDASSLTALTTSMSFL